MPRRSILSTTEQDSLLALPENQEDLIQHYMFNELDHSIILQHRGAANRLGFAIQLSYMRYPGIMLGADEVPFPVLLHFVASLLRIPVEAWDEYGRRDQTRREHLREIQSIYGFKPFTMTHYRPAVQSLDELAKQTDKGITLARALIQNLRNQLILLPSINVIERICAEAITRATRHIYTSLTEQLCNEHHRNLDALLNLQENGNTSSLIWLRQSPSAPNAKHILEHLDRLRVIEALMLPEGIERQIHQNRLLKLAREGGQMTAQHLRDLEATRRYATLVAIVLEAKATVIDEVIDLHARIIGTLFNRAKRNHEQQFQQSGKAINDKVRLYWRIGNALLEARQSGGDPFAAIESVIPWDIFAQSITEAQQLARSEDFDYLHKVSNGYPQIRRYAPAFLKALQLKAASAAQDILDAINMLRVLNASNTRKVPQNAPTGFVRKRWKNLVFTESGIDRRFYELCALSELKNALRSGDICKLDGSALG